MDTVGTVRRWMAGLLAVAYLLDIGVVGIGWSPPALLLPIPLIAAVFLALRLPVLGGLAGAGVVLATSLFLRVAEVHWYGSYWLVGLSATEALAGMMLVAVLIWRTSRSIAVFGSATLLAAAAGAMWLRRPEYYDFDLVPAGVVLAVGAGAALRLGAGDTEMRQFLRGQWPLALALAIALLVDAGTTLDVDRYGIYALAPVLAAILTAVCAILGPRDPIRWALTAAAVVLLTAAATVAIALAVNGRMRGWQPPLSVIAAHMALIAYVVRYTDRTRATIGVVALVGADLIAVVGMLGGVRLRPDRDMLLIAAFLLLLSVATGQYFGSRDRARNQSVRVAVTGAQQAERMALARELHDVVAHHVTGIVVQAQAAQLVADPAKRAEALARIERSGTEALTAMRMLVGSMRGAQAGEAGAADAATADLAADLRAVVDGFAGPRVHLHLSLPDALPPEAGRTVLRIVQESLTNVTKHAADATHVRVEVEQVDGELRVRVADDATRAGVRPAGGSGGYGLVGMRERVELLGGTFAAGPGHPGGWTVDARFPLRKDAS